MRIGIIQGENPSIHSGYYFMCLTYADNIEIVSNKQICSQFKAKPVTVLSINEIESDTTLDYVLYGWYYLIKEKKLPKSKAKRVVFACADKVYWYFNKEFLTLSDICFKIACPKDRYILKDNNRRPSQFNTEKDNLTTDDINKIHPLMYIGTGGDYPVSKFTREYKISFYGSITSLDRIQSVKILKEYYKNDFIGGFVKDTRGKEVAYDEDGNNISNIDVSKYCINSISRLDYFKLHKRSIINLSPSGWGRSTHRFVDILCLGGFGLICDISHIDYGPLSPIENIHYMPYKKDFSDILEKADYFIKNPEKAEIIGNNAYNFMKDTYLNFKRMGETYILAVLK